MRIFAFNIIIIFSLLVMTVACDKYPNATEETFKGEIVLVLQDDVSADNANESLKLRYFSAVQMNTLLSVLVEPQAGAGGLSRASIYPKDKAMAQSDQEHMFFLENELGGLADNVKLRKGISFFLAGKFESAILQMNSFAEKEHGVYSLIYCNMFLGYIHFIVKHDYENALKSYDFVIANSLSSSSLNLTSRFYRAGCLDMMNKSDEAEKERRYIMDDFKIFKNWHSYVSTEKKLSNSDFVISYYAIR